MIFHVFVGFFSLKKNKLAQVINALHGSCIKKGEKNPLKQVKLHLNLQKNICQCHYSFCLVSFHSFTQPHYGGSLFQYLFSYLDLNGNISLSEKQYILWKTDTSWQQQEGIKETGSKQEPGKNLSCPWAQPHSISDRDHTIPLWTGKWKKTQIKNLLREYDVYTALLLRYILYISTSLFLHFSFQRQAMDLVLHSYVQCTNQKIAFHVENKLKTQSFLLTNIKATSKYKKGLWQFLWNSVMSRLNSTKQKLF